VLAGRDLRALFRDGDRFVEPAEFVHQAEALRLRPVHTRPCAMASISSGFLRRAAATFSMNWS